MQKSIRLMLLSGCLGLASAAWACNAPEDADDVDATVRSQEVAVDISGSDDDDIEVDDINVDDVDDDDVDVTVGSQGVAINISGGDDDSGGSVSINIGGRRSQ